MQLTKREQIETTIAQLLLSNKLSTQESEAVMFLVNDFHKMSSIEDIVIPHDNGCETIKTLDRKGK